MCDSKQEEVPRRVWGPLTAVATEAERRRGPVTEIGEARQRKHLHLSTPSRRWRAAFSQAAVVICWQVGPRKNTNFAGLQQEDVVAKSTRRRKTEVDGSRAEPVSLSACE
ncbi:hypothetical protein HPB50_003782 [Hyalomma asiaticum]|uniref:Uncharacterized protein n=1 Tax=Hyalomma asiaticum TaxID=266040 RepID=A0ACB7S3Z2_HYAAI|nr:hypothetical protein HPB50_003782 [Hyalomma asiaticum]